MPSNVESIYSHFHVILRKLAAVGDKYRSRPVYGFYVMDASSKVVHSMKLSYRLVTL